MHPGETEKKKKKERELQWYTPESQHLGDLRLSPSLPLEGISKTPNAGTVVELKTVDPRP